MPHKPTLAITSCAAKNVAALFPSGRGRKVKNISFVGVLIWLFFVGNAFGQSPYTCIATGNWNDDATWSGTGTPIAGDVVTIAGGFTVTVNISNAACQSLQLGGTAANTFGILTFAATGSPQLTVSGTTTVGGTGSTNVNRRGEILFVAGSTFETGSLTLTQGAANNPAVVNMTNGGLLRTGSFTLGGGVVTWTPGTGTVDMTASNTLPATVFTTFHNLIISAGTTTLSSNKNSTATGTINIRTGATLALSTFTYGATTPPVGLTMECGGASASTLSSSTGTLTLGGNITINDNTGGTAGAIISARLASTAVRTYTVADDGTAAVDLTISGIYSGTGGGIIKAGSGSMTLSGANTYTGNTTVNAGSLITGANNVLPATTVTVNDGATLNLNNFSDAIGALTVNSGATGGTVTTGSGTLTLGGNVTSTGGATNALISGILALGGNRNFTLTNAADGLTISAVISGAFTLTKNGNGTLILSGTNTYTGLTTISVGTLRLNNTAALGTTAAGTSITSGAVLDLNGINYTTAEALTINGTGISSGGAVINSNATGATYGGLITLGSASSIVAGTGTIAVSNAGTITGATFGLILGGNAGGTLSSILGTTTGTLTKSGAGTWTLSGVSTYTGLTTVSAGTLRAGVTNAIASGAVTVNDGGTYDLNGFNETIGALTVNSGATGGTVTTGSGTLTLGGNVTSTGGATNALISGNLALGANRIFTLTNAADGLTVSAIISGAFTLTKNGNGILTLSGTNTYSGATTLSAGQLNINNTSAIGTGALIINGGTINNTTGSAITLTTNNPITIGANFTFGGTNNLNMGTGAITNTVTSRTITLNGTNSVLTFGGLMINGFAGTQTTTVNGAGNTFVLGAYNLSNSATNRTGIFNGTGNVTITGVIANGGTSTASLLTYSGSGVLTLSGTNTYAGVTTVSSGTMRLNNTAALGNTSAGTSITSGAVLDLNGINYTSAEALTVNGTGISSGGAVINSNATGATFGGLLTLGSASSIVGGTGTITISNAGTITGATFGLTLGGTAGGTLTSILGTTSGTLIKSGSGTWNLSGANTYTGLTTISAGTLRLNNTAALGTTANGTSITSGAVLDLNGVNYTTAEALTVNGTGISSGGAVINSNATGATFGGLLTLGSASSIVGGTGTITLSNAGTITGATFGLTLGGTAGGTLTSILGTTSGTLTKSGSGTWTLSGANTYTGLTTISAGTLRLNNTAALGTTANGTSITNGAVLDLNGLNYTTAEALTINGTGISNGGAVINSNATGATFGGLLTLGSTSSISGGTGTISLSNVGTITGATFGLTLDGSAGGSITSILGTTSGTLTKSGSGTWTLSGANTYTGATTINAGTLRAGIATNAFGNASAVTLANVSGAILDLNGNNNTIGSLTGGGGTGGNVTLGAATLTIGSDNSSPAAYAGIISGTAITKIGTGTLTLSGTNTYTGLTTVSAGILNIQNAQGTGTIAGGVTVASGAQLQLEGDITVGNESLTLTGEGIASDGALRNISGNNTWGGTITLSTNSRINSAAGSLTLSASNAITATNFNLNLGGAGNNIVSGIIALGSGTLTKGGAGTLTLSGANTYTGGTALNNGTLNINNSSALGTAAGTFSIAAACNIDNTSGGDITTNNHPLALNGDFTYIGSVPRNLNLGTGAVTMSASRQITVSAGTLTIGGVINDNTQNVTKAGAGTLSFGSQAVTLNDFTISGGTFISTSNTLTLAGNFSNSGTFTHNSGTVTFNAAGAQNIGTATFNNLICTTSGTKQATGDITVSGALTLSSTARLAIGSNTLTLNGTASTMSTTNCLVGNATANLTIGGTGALGTNLFFDQTTPGASNRVNNFTLNRGSQTITLGDSLRIGGTFTPTAGTLASGGLLVIASYNTGTGRIAAGSGSYITGNVIAERFIPSVSRRWRFLSSPVSSGTFSQWQARTHITGAGAGSDISLTNYTSLYGYDETVTGSLNSGWVAPSGTAASIVVGKGYRLFVRGDRNPGRLNETVTDQNDVTLNVTGPPNMGNITLPLTITNTGDLTNNDGWNLVGNPYASPYDWNAHWDAGGVNCTNIGATISIYDPKTNNYASYNADGGATIGDLPDGIIPSGSAFWVKVPAYAPTPNLTFIESFKVAASNGTRMFKTDYAFFTIKMNGDALNQDQLIAQYRSDASSGLDKFDIEKFFGGEVSISSIASDGKYLAANIKSFTSTYDSIAISASAIKSGKYTFEFENVDQLMPGKTIQLVDQFTQQIVNLYNTNSYTFDIDINNKASFGVGRFYLLIGKETFNNTPETLAPKANKKIDLYPSVFTNEFTLRRHAASAEQAAVSIVDITGKSVASFTNLSWINDEIKIDASLFASGTYLVKIVSGEITHVAKCVKE